VAATCAAAQDDPDDLLVLWAQPSLAPGVTVPDRYTREMPAIQMEFFPAFSRLHFPGPASAGPGRGVITVSYERYR